MNSAEKAAAEAAVAHASRKAVEVGIMQAVKMIRAAAVARPGITMLELADAIERTVKEAQATPSSLLQS